MASNAQSATWGVQPKLAHAAESSDLPDILYVMGTGRSGTTILEVLLTNDEGITGTGELKHIFRDGFVRDLQCACGKPGHECGLWSRVLQESGWSQEECGNIGRAIEDLEGHANFPRVILGAVNEDKAAVYERATTQLLRAVRRITGSRVVVDSSKYPARALLLTRMYPGRVKVLCITRSAAGLIAAFQKQNEGEQRPKSRIAAAAYYLYVLLCMRLVCARLKERCLAIRFEDLNRDPVEVLSRVETWSGISFAAARAKIAAADYFQVGHIVTGNRLRKKGKVRFDPSTSKARGESGMLLTSLLERYRNLMGF